MPASVKTEVDVDGQHLTLSNLTKVLYPEVGFTKGDVIHYYTQIAPVLLPHIAGHPMTMKRYPNGVEGKFFYEKRCPKHAPDFIKTAHVWSGANSAYIDYCLFDDLPTLVWAANIADLELHASLSRDGSPDVPAYLAFDLDPGPGTSIVECCDVALRIRELLDGLGLQSFAKTSGSKGMQFYVPLNMDDVTYDDTKPFSKAMAQLMEQRNPDLVVSRQAKDLRHGKVLVDWSQNDPHKTTIAVYSLRARPHPTVSTPITWDEVSNCLDSKDPDDLRFTSDDVLARVEQHGDLFEPVRTLTQDLPRFPAA